MSRDLDVPAPSLVTTVLSCNNSLLRAGLEHVLSQTHFVVSDAVFDNSASSLPDTPPVLLILARDDLNGATAELVATLKAHRPEVRVAVLAPSFDIATLTAVWRAGVDGIWPTATDPAALTKALELVMLGYSVLPSSILREIARSPQTQVGENNLTFEASGDLPQPHKLSRREWEVLDCLRKGGSNKEIALQFNLSEATIKVHVKAILRKIGVGNRTQAAMWAAQNLPTDPAEPST